METKYSNNIMISLSQVVYLNFTDKEITDYINNPDHTGYPTIRDLLVARCGDEENVANGNRENAYKLHYCYFGQDPYKYEPIDEVVQFIDGILGISPSSVYTTNHASKGNVWDIDVSETEKRTIAGNDYYLLDIADWRVSSVLNNNDKSGMVAMTLLAPNSNGDGENAVVVFRGSEASDNTNNDNEFDLKTFVKDWVMADVDIAHGEVTVQEQEARDYLAQILSDEKIATVATAGHSLGGNLAMVSAVLNANNANIDKYVQGSAFDAPGQPSEFHETYKNNIAAIKDKLYHYHYSMVGSVFRSVAGTYLEIDTVDEKYGWAGSHSLFNIDIEGNSVKVVDTKDSVNAIGSLVQWVTNQIDHNMDEKKLEELLDFIDSARTLYLLVSGDKYASNYSVLDLTRAYQDVSYHVLDSAATFTGNKPLKNCAKTVGLIIEVSKMIEQFNAGQYRTGVKNLFEYVGSAFGELSMPSISNLFGLNITDPVGMLVGAINTKLNSNQSILGGKIGSIAGDLFCNLLGIQNTGTGSNVASGNMSNQSVTNLISNLPQALMGVVLSKMSNSTPTGAQVTTVRNVLLNLGSWANSFTVSVKFAGFNIINNVHPLCFLDGITKALVSYIDYLDFGTDGGNYAIELEDNLNRMVEKEIKDTIATNVTQLYHTAGIRRVYNFSSGDMLDFDTDDSIQRWNDFRNEYELYVQTVLAELAALDEAFEASRQSVRYNPDPLVLDLDLDGVSLLSKEEGVYFDEDSKGLKEKTQWIGAEDALLAIDLNNNGIIDGGEELFGTSTLLGDGTLARTGFEALMQYDSNGDGIIDEQDDVFDRLLVWRDSNVDGVTDEGELETLRHHGIERISLADGEGDEGERRTTLVQYSDGHTANLSEVDFEADYYDVREKEEIEISDIIKELPNVQAIGNIPSLHTLMQLDESGELQELVEAFMTAETVDEREEICTAIIEKICGADRVADGSRGTEFDAKKLTVIEAFMGSDFVGTEGSNPVNTAASLLSEVYDKLYSLYYGLLAKESVLQPYLSLVYMYENDEGKRYIDTSYFDFYAKLSIENEIDMKNIVPEMARFISMMNPDSIENLTDFVKQYADYEGYVDEFSKCHLGVLFGTSEDDTIFGTGNADIIFAGTRNDVLQGNNGIDVLYGNSGDDALYGENGNDTLNGGSGNDHMDGGSGSDTFVFNIGDGVDTVFDYDGEMTSSDKISFGTGIVTSDVHMERHGDNLIVWYSQRDCFTVIDAYKYEWGTGKYFIETMEFADGTIWNTEDVANRACNLNGTGEDDTINGFAEAVGYHTSETIHGLEGNDTINAGDGDDILYGDAGNDALYGENGNDILIGGAGNDHMDGGYGNDTFVFNIGDGADTVFDFDPDMVSTDRIHFGSGISSSNVRMQRQGNDLQVWYTDNDSFTVLNAYLYEWGTGHYFVESMEFEDGTIWNTEDIASRASNLIGTIGDDTINGFAEAVGYHTSETIHGLEGNDTINAGDGEDILYGDAGNDALYGENGNDILIGGAGNDHMDGGYGNDTFVFNIGDGTDTVFDFDPDMVSTDRIHFGSGISSSDVRMQRQGNDLQVWYTDNDSFTVLNAYLYEWGTGHYFVESMEFEDGTVWNTNEIANRAGNLSGTEGNDTINGFAEAVGYHQDENIHGLEGNDSINAGDGNDILYGDEGDDVLYGGNGEDYLTGGTGSDYLDGGFGNDTYFFERGDGADTIYDFEDSFTSGKEDKIVFGSEIGIEDISIQRSGNDLIVTYGENDQITIASAYQYYWGEGKYQIENVEFHDGTQAGIDYTAESLVVTYQPEPECALGEELSDGVSSLMAEAIDIETEQEVNLIIQEMSSPVEGNVSEHLTQEQPTVTTDELLWTE